MPKKDIYYEDLSLDPVINSEGDITSVTNEQSIKQSLYMIINIAKGTRIFLPEYGCRIKGFLFEPFDQTTATRLGTELEETIQNYEPRVQVVTVQVVMDWKKYAYDVSVVYRINNTQNLDAIKVSLDKL